jgi:hypothetical protein
MLHSYLYSFANVGTRHFMKAECSLSVLKNMYFFSSKRTLVMARVAKAQKAVAGRDFCWAV